MYKETECELEPKLALTSFGLELKSWVLESLFQRRTVKAPKVAFISLYRQPMLLWSFGDASELCGTFRIKKNYLWTVATGNPLA